ncbi:MAG: response regulator transcription factor [Acidobacteria bacterium]|nr:response regulator transcription factor [Acidobacteriota bacterium]MCB9399106.1 response regulator transcription factor [Acidobacteriota bacterium]
MSRILIIEDEDDIARLLEFNLVREGFDVQKADTGHKGLTVAQQQLPDLILLDLMLPELNGLEVCRRLKANPKTARIPLIMLTAKGEEADVVTGLELGADDYIAKPFSIRILLARVRSVLRRGAPLENQESEWVHVGDLKIHTGRHEAVLAEETLPLTPLEFQLLLTLASKPGWVFTRNQIVAQIRGEDYAVTDRAVDVLMVGLRKKCGDFATRLETVRGIGYRLAEGK